MSAEQIVKTYLAIGLALIICGVIKAFKRRDNGERHWSWMKAKCVKDGITSKDRAGNFIGAGIVLIAMIWPIYLVSRLSRIWRRP